MKKSIISLILVALAALSANARTINISGQVLFKDKQPAGGVQIYTFDDKGNKIRLSQTDDDGNFRISADDEGKLLFAYDEVIDPVTVNVNEQFEINVEVFRKPKVLKEVVAYGGKVRKNTFPLDDAVVEIEGNWVKLKKYRVNIPPMFDSEKRIIIQPAFYNSTRNELTNLPPRVIDGWRYGATQERMYDWDLAKDTLASGPHYYVKNPHDKTDNFIIIRDSIYVENPDDVLFTVVIPQVESYNKIVFVDSFQVGVGTTNPFRFLKFKLNPMLMNESIFLPQDKAQPRDTKGEMNLMFSVGKSNLDLDLGNNSMELNNLVSEINKISNDQDSKLKGISIFGFASPEGSYETNTKLANARMKSALDFVKQSIELKKTVKLNSEATVTPWEDVIKALRTDSLIDEANQLQEILDKYTGHDAQARAISRLPFYRPLLTDTYLPRMRRVNYTINYDFYRLLNDDEIREQYKIDPTRLTKNHFYRYYSSCEGQEKEDVLKKALEVYPDMYIAATDLAKIMIERDENPSEILAPYFADYSKWKTLPVSTRYNYGIASMMSKRYTLADSLFSTVQDTPDTHIAKLYCDLMNGYMVNTDEIAKDNPLNQVLILLKIQQNQSAYEMAKQLGESAEEEYVKAMAANRVSENDFEAEAMAPQYLESAIRKKHKLYEMALTDQDVVDLLQYIDDIEGILNSPEEADVTPEEEEASEVTEEEQEADSNSESQDETNSTAQQ